MPSNIILIGPMGAGKSTVGKLLAQKLNLPFHEMDLVRWKYYKELGFDIEKANRILETEGAAGVYRQWKPLEAYAVERLLGEHTGIFAFGGGHSVYEDNTLSSKRSRVSWSPMRMLCYSSPLRTWTNPSASFATGDASLP